MQRNRFIRKTALIELAALALVLLAISLPHLAGLARFVTPDEYLWLARSANFYEALTRRDYASTYQAAHPGVTIMWAGAAGLSLVYPDYLKSDPGQVDTDRFHELMEARGVPVSLLEVLRAERLVMVVAQLVVLALSYFYARRLFGTLPALLGFLFIAFDPFHLGLTRLLHLDGMLANLLFLSLLAFLVFLVNRRVVNLLVSAAAGGLAFLTKSPGVVMLPVIGALVLVELWRATRQDGFSWRLAWHSLWPVLAWLATGAVVIFAFWPAMWVHPLATLSQIFGSAQDFAESGHTSALFFNGQIIPDGNLGWRFFYFYPLTYLWRATPVALGGLALAVWGFAARRKPFDRREARLATLGLLLFCGAFLAGMTIGEKKFDRYLVPVYPALDLIAGAGWSFLAMALSERLPAVTRRWVPALLLIIIVGIQMTGTLSTYPYYISYYNPLMGGAWKAPQVMQIGWGEGIDQAARYLNQKPDVGKLKVIAWYDTGSFSYFFNGADRTFWATPGQDPDNWQKFITSDYAVVYIQQWQRQIPKEVLEYLSGIEPEHTVWIDGLEYVRIYKLP